MKFTKGRIFSGLFYFCAMDLERQIENSTAHRAIRDEISGYVLGNRDTFYALFALALDTSSKNHHKACWNLELVLEKKIDWLTPFLDEFCDALPAFTDDGARRSISKICLFIGREHFAKNSPGFAADNQLEKIASACFDWLIGDSKVATKAYAMRALFLLGKKFDWIHSELGEILPKDFSMHSAAYRAVAREILKKLR